MRGVIGAQVLVVGSMLGCAGCYLSHERPLDVVACAPFVVSAEGVITNAPNAHFEVRSDLTLRALAIEAQESFDGSAYFSVIAEVVNDTGEPICPETGDATLLIDDGRAELVEALTVPYLVGGERRLCWGSGERGLITAQVRSGVRGPAGVDGIERVVLQLDGSATSTRPEPDPEAPTFGPPRWEPLDEAPGLFTVSLPVTSSGNPSELFGAGCALWSTRCALPIVPQLASWAVTEDGWVAQTHVDSDPATWVDREVRCYALPLEHR